ncbi:hypothetical protein VM1G_03691 [Cytospora mali]|uniref:Uncharacterized protein n=1 Tax=Cytospora mali TaxID=578113 RepID=A0A194VX94_CYTMA|nr:hypothetical protein VM1G_03691 [Valsa mali]
MSSNTSNTNDYATLPDPEETTASQYYLLQTLDNGIQRVPLPHPAHDLARRPTQRRRRHQIQVHRVPTNMQTTRVRRVRNRQQNRALDAMQAEFQRKMMEQAQMMQENLERYGTSHPKEMILKAGSDDLSALLRSIKPHQLQAMDEFAVALMEADEDVPAYTADVFNSLMGRDTMMPLKVHTFEIVIR